MFIVGATMRAKGDYNWAIGGIATSTTEAQAMASALDTDKMFGWYLGPIPLNTVSPPDIVSGVGNNWPRAKYYYSDGTVGEE